MVLIYYYDLMSQPSRALYIFLKAANIPFEACPVSLQEGQHYTEEFKELNRFQKVPFIDHNGFKLAESVGIFRYLCREYDVKDNWYPRDSKRQAKADEYLEWQHLNIRLHCSSYFFSKWVIPKLSGKEPKPEKLKILLRNMYDSLDKFEEYFLSNGPFINGETISFADILAACEIEQPRMAGVDCKENRAKLTAWLERVRTECNPYYDEAHAIFNVETKAKL